MSRRGYERDPRQIPRLRHERGPGQNSARPPIRITCLEIASPRCARALRLYRGLGYRDTGGAGFRKGPFRCFEKTLDLDA